jgi:hypothetical protein
VIESVLSRMDGGDPGSDLPRLRGFRQVLALVVATEYWTKGLRDRSLLDPLDWLQVGLATGLAAIVVATPSGRAKRAAFVGFAALQSWWIAQYFPLAGNHRYLELWLALLLAGLDDAAEDERRLLLRALRWTAVVVLVASGLQKAVHGYWFRGQFLAWSVWQENVRFALAPLLSAGELARFDAGGPWIVDRPLVVALSNAVWIAEVSLGGLLVPRRTRAWAWIAAVALLAATELVAREMMFGIEFAAALMLFARGAVVQRFVVPAGLLLGALVAVRAGWLPEVLFH